MSNGEASASLNPASRAGHATGRWIAPALLVLVPFLLYASMIVRGWEPAAPDTEAARAFSTWGAAEQARVDHVPDWYPHIFGGMPSYGSFTYTPRSVIHPLAWVQRAVGQNRGLWYLVLCSVAGIAGYAFLRRQGFSRPASTAAALVYSVTPYFMGNVAAGHSTKLEALCLVPVFILALDLLLDRPEPLRAAFLTLAAAALAWSNHPQVAYYAVLIGSLYGIGRLVVERKSREQKRYLPRLAGWLLASAVLALGLVLEPYLAVREYLPWSIRGGTGAVGGEPGSSGVGWEYATAWSFHPRELISFLFPGWYGLEGMTYWGPMPFTQSTHYFGIVALVLAVVGLVRLRGPRRWIWGGISLVVLVIGFGRYLPLLYGPLYHLVPMFNKFRVPSMVYGVLPFCLSYLVAGGLDALAGGAGASAAGPGVATKGSGRSRAPGRDARLAKSRPGQSLLVIAGSAIALWVLLALGARAGLGGEAIFRPEELRGLDPARLAALQSERMSILQGSLAQGMLLVLALLAVLLLSARRGARTAWTGVAIAVLAVTDVVLVSRVFYHPQPRQASVEPIPLRGACEFLARQPGSFRFLPAGREIFNSNAFGLVGLESVGGYHPAKLRAYQDLLGSDLVMTPPVLKMLNVRYILSSTPLDWEIDPTYEGDGHVYPFPDSLARAWSVEQVTKVADFRALARRFEDPGFDPGREALVYPGDQPARDRFAAADVEVLEQRTGYLRARVRAGDEAFVVLSEIAFPPGWIARAGGRSLPLRRVNHVLQGVEFPAGEHELVLEARSVARVRGARVSRLAGAAMLLLAAGGFWIGRKRPRSPGQ